MNEMAVDEQAQLPAEEPPVNTEIRSLDTWVRRIVLGTLTAVCGILLLREVQRIDTIVMQHEAEIHALEISQAAIAVETREANRKLDALLAMHQPKP